jgi:hypothetical protein
LNGKTINNLLLTNANGTAYQINGGGTINDLQINTPGVTPTIKFQSANTVTLTSITMSGFSSALKLVWTSVGGAATHTISAATTLIADFLDLSWSTGAGAGIPFLARFSTDSGNNTNWTFSDGGDGGFMFTEP